MKPLPPSLRAAGQVLVVLLALVAQVGEGGWLGLMHRLACECCGEHAAEGCCSSPAHETGPVVAAQEDGRCACAVVPSERAPAAPALATAGGSSREDLRPLHAAAVLWSAPEDAGLRAARASDPPPRVLWPTGRFDGFSRRLLLGTGGERSSCLGCARS